MGVGFPCAAKILLLAQAAAASIAGTVRDGASGVPLAGAVVSLADLDRSAVADGEGRYLLREVPAGPQHVVVRRIGYAPRMFHALVPPEGTLAIDVGLTAVPVPLGTIEVRAPARLRGLDEIGGTTVPDRGLTLDAIRNHPLLPEADVFQAFGGGEVALRPESPSGIHVRGAASDEIAYLLDGVPVLSPYHAAGTFSAWNPDALARMDLVTSAPSPGLPDALSGVLSGTTRAPGPQHEIRGSLSTTQARVTIDGPLGRGGAGYLLSLRSPFPGLAASKPESSYLHGESGDRLGKLEGPLWGGRLGLLGYDSGTELDAAAAVRETSGAPPEAGAGRNAFAWHSRSLGAHWTRQFSGSAVQLQAWSAAGDAEVTWRGSDSTSERLRADRGDEGLLAMVELTGPGARTALGVRTQWTQTSYRLRSLSGQGHTLSLSNRTPVSAAFLRHARRLLPGIELELAIAGTLAGGGAYLSPRAQLRWTPSQALSLAASYLRSHQFAQSLRNAESVVDNIFPADLYLGAGGSGVPVAWSDQGILALEYRPTGAVRLGVQAYARSFEGLALVAPRDAEPFATTGFAEGSGSARGLSLQVAAHGARYGILVGYALEHVRLEYGDSSYVPGHGATQSIDLGAIVFPSASFSVRLGVTGLLGRRTTAVEGPFEWEGCNLLDRGCEFAGSPGRRSEPLGATALPAYIRVDFGVRKHWHLRVGGRDALVGVFGTATNILGRKNVLTIVVDPPTGERREIEMRPRSPLVVGLDWRF